MADWVSPNKIKEARKADLYDFLLTHHPNLVKIEGNSMRLKDNRSVTLKKEYSGWKDWATDESGNSIEFLTTFLGYEFKDAVEALTEGLSNISKQPTQEKKENSKEFILPDPIQGPYKQLFAYLYQIRKIPINVIQSLINEGLIYQEATHNNIVFVNPARTFAEIRGSNSYKPYHQVQFSQTNDFWWMKTHGINSTAQVAFICESAIDAISLHLLRQQTADPDFNALYCSIGGVANQQRIDYIKENMNAAGRKTILAVDNDPAGKACRNRNSDLPSIIPTNKDWNEDWIAKYT